jgi:hypothetical protein
MSRLALRLLRALAVAATLSLTALPLLLALFLGLQHRRLPGDVGAGSGIVIILALVYIVWLPLTIYGLVWLLDRLGIHYTPPDRARVPTRKEGRRTRAGLRFLAGRPTLHQRGSQGAAAPRRHDRGGGSAGGGRSGDEGR